MKVVLACVGRPGALLRDAIAEYERRAARYWALEVVEVREEKARRGTADGAIRRAETERLLTRVQDGMQVAALMRTGKPLSSASLARDLGERALRGDAGVAFVIGGALGLDASTLPPGARRLSLGAITLTHELARLVFAEQLYRAGTIVRGEPYHKG